MTESAVATRLVGGEAGRTASCRSGSILESKRYGQNDIRVLEHTNCGHSGKHTNSGRRARIRVDAHPAFPEPSGGTGMATRRRRRFTADFKKRVGRSKRCGGTGRCRRSPPGTRSISAAWCSGRNPPTGTTAFLPTGFYEQPRLAMTNSVCNCGRDSTRQPGPATDRYGNLHTSRFVRPLAGCATLISIEEFVLVAQNVRGGAAAASVAGFRRWPRRTAGRGLGSLSRFGDGVESVCCGGPPVVSGMRRAGSTERDRVIGSLQRHPARTGMNP